MSLLPAIPRPARAGSKAQTLILEVGRTLARYGTPAHRLEQAMVTMSSSLELRGEFFSTPTSLMASFGDGHAAVMRVEAGEMNLEKLVQLDALVERVTSGGIDCDEALVALRAIDEAPPRFGAGWIVLAYGLVSGAAARFFGGGAAEIATGAGIGLVIGVLSKLLGRRPEGTRVFELAAAFSASLMATAMAALRSDVSASLTTLAGLIVLIPGLTLTVAMSELATRNLVSGTARLMAAVIVFLEMAVGVALATELAPPISRAGGGTLPFWTQLAALAVAAVALVALFQARPRAIIWITGMCFLGFWGSRLGAWLLGPELGVFAGAFAVGAGSNAYARALRRPATETLVPAILLLVPGSVGFQGISALLNQDTLTGIDTLFHMFVVAAAIVTGLLVANATVPPRRAL